MNLSRLQSVLGAAVLALSSLLVPSWSQAASSFELILDTGFDLNSRDLSRTRSDSTGLSITGADATIIAQNNVNAAFGINSTSQVTYTHDMNWISPAAASILSANLIIDAIGAGGTGFLGLTPNDSVYADGNFIGNLNVGTILTGFISLTNLSINPLWLADGLLNIQINHVPSTDSFSVFGSKLIIDYTGAPSSVPEPSSILLMASGLAGLGLYGRRKLAPATTK